MCYRALRLLLRMHKLYGMQQVKVLDERCRWEYLRVSYSIRGER